MISVFVDAVAGRALLCLWSEIGKVRVADLLSKCVSVVVSVVVSLPLFRSWFHDAL